MKSAMALFFICLLLLAVESSILLVETNSFQSWGEQDLFVAMLPHKEQATYSAAKGAASTMPVPQKHLHMDLEVERLEYKVRRLRVGAVQPPHHPPSSRISARLAWAPSHYERRRDTTRSQSRPDMTLPESDVQSLGKSRASSNQIRTQATTLPIPQSDSGRSESHGAVQKPKATSTPVLFKEGSEADAKPVNGIPTPQRVYAGEAFGAVHAVGLSNMTLAFAKTRPIAWPSSSNFAHAGTGGVADEVPSEVANATWRPAEMRWTITPSNAKKPTMAVDTKKSTKTVDAEMEMTIVDAEQQTTNVAAALTCVCNGTFKEGDRVKFTGHSYPPGRAFGTILGGTSNGFLNIDWEHWSSGHSGHCKFTTCGTCSVSSTKSRWFTECGEVDVEYHVDPVIVRAAPAIATAL